MFQVEEFRVRDAAKGIKIAQVLEGFISRKVVKQTVMTVVYGVTRYGGRLQIEKRLKEIDDFPKVGWGVWECDGQKGSRRDEWLVMENNLLKILLIL